MSDQEISKLIHEAERYGASYHVVEQLLRHLKSDELERIKNLVAASLEEQKFTFSLRVKCLEGTVGGFELETLFSYKDRHETLKEALEEILRRKDVGFFSANNIRYIAFFRGHDTLVDREISGDTTPEAKRHYSVVIEVKNKHNYTIKR